MWKLKTKVCSNVEKRFVTPFLWAAYGGHLTAVTTEGEHNFLREFVRYYRDGFYFIGLDRRDMFSNLVWQDSQLLDYSGWASGYPTDSKFERCVALATSEDGLWTTVSCDKSFHFVCEYQRGKRFANTLFLSYWLVSSVKWHFNWDKTDDLRTCTWRSNQSVKERSSCSPLED